MSPEDAYYRYMSTKEFASSRELTAYVARNCGVTAVVLTPDPNKYADTSEYAEALMTALLRGCATAAKRMR